MNHIEQTIDFLKEELVDKKPTGRLFATSSFQTQSVPLLHILGLHFRQVSVIFLDTGFLFPETYEFKNYLRDLFRLEVVELKSKTSLIQQRDSSTGLLEYSINPNNCCNMNKVQPLNDFLRDGDIWISGIRKDQTKIRKAMKPVTVGVNNTRRLHPMLHWEEADIEDYIAMHSLPKHPLEKEGYKSISCVPCTFKNRGNGRKEMRWRGSQKTECGLHLNNTK